MATRRMVSKSISTSKKLSKVDNFTALLYTWIIPHCDDAGDMDRDSAVVKAKVIPMRNENKNNVEKALESLADNELIIPYDVDGQEYLHIVKWTDHQTLRIDRAGFFFPIFECTCCENPLWRNMGKEPATDKPTGNRKAPKRQPVKVKPEASIGYLKKIPKKDINYFLSRFEIKEKEVNGKAEDLILYCERKGKIYRNYRSFLLNAIKKDFRERDLEAEAIEKAKKEEMNMPVSEADRKKSFKAIEEARKKIFKGKGVK